MKLKFPLYLGSQSPRRKEILNSANINFTSLPLSVTEKFNPLSSPQDICISISKSKWLSCYNNFNFKEPSLILTADTMVFLDGNPFGKPKDREEAHFFLNSLSHRTHQVITAFCLGLSNEGFPNHSKVDISEISFKKLNDDIIYNYIETNSPFDKAGGYGIQDEYVQKFILEGFNGDLNNVIGLPIHLLLKTLKDEGWII